MATGPLKQARERFRAGVPSTLRAPVAAFFSRTPILRGFLANAKDLEVLDEVLRRHAQELRVAGGAGDAMVCEHDRPAVASGKELTSHSVP
jgi:hypothetical protein